MIKDIILYDFYSDVGSIDDVYAVSFRIFQWNRPYPYEFQPIYFTVQVTAFVKAIDNGISNSVWVLAVIDYANLMQENIAKSIANYYAIIYNKHVRARLACNLRQIISDDMKWLKQFYPQCKDSGFEDCILRHLKKLEFIKSIKYC